MTPEQENYDHLGDFSEVQYNWFTEQLAHLAVDHMSESHARCVAMEHMIIMFRGQHYAFPPQPQTELFKQVLEMGGPSVLKEMLDEMPNNYKEDLKWQQKNKWEGETWLENYKMSPFTR